MMLMYVNCWGRDMHARMLCLGNFRVLEIEIAQRAEIGGILGVGKGIPPLDIVESQFVEPRRDE